MPAGTILTKSFPTRYAAAENPGAWVFLDVNWDAVPPPVEGRHVDVRWSEMAVYDCPQIKTHATVRRHPFPIGGKEYVANLIWDGYWRSVPAASFADALRVAEDFVG